MTTPEYKLALIRSLAAHPNTDDPKATLREIKRTLKGHTLEGLTKDRLAEPCVTPVP